MASNNILTSNLQNQTELHRWMSQYLAAHPSSRETRCRGSCVVQHWSSAALKQAAIDFGRHVSPRDGLSAADCLRRCFVRPPLSLRTSALGYTEWTPPWQTLHLVRSLRAANCCSQRRLSAARLLRLPVVSVCVVVLLVNRASRSTGDTRWSVWASSRVRKFGLKLKVTLSVLWNRFSTLYVKSSVMFYLFIHYTL